MQNSPIAAGKSSFDLVDLEKIMAEIGPLDGKTLLDAACGVGNYATAVAAGAGERCRVIAVDLWQEGIDQLEERLRSEKIDNVFARAADISRHIPVENGAVQVCLMATVFHDLVEDGTDRGTLLEISRVLDPNGILAVVEFKEMEGPPGPPIHIRISPANLAKSSAAVFGICAGR